MDAELFELCKDVYERTGWGEATHDTDVIEHKPVIFYPEYNSDYLIEKLPRSIRQLWSFELVPTMRNTRWSAGYWTHNRLDTLSVVDDTPIKALLKLTIELHGAGELNSRNQSTDVAV